MLLHYNTVTSCITNIASLLHIKFIIR